MSWLEWLAAIVFGFGAGATAMAAYVSRQDRRAKH